MNEEIIMPVLDEPIEEIAKDDKLLSEGIKKMREGNINIKPGYDGVFGVVKIWGEGKPEAEVQEKLF